jgi:hypothetical protein
MRGIAEKRMVYGLEGRSLLRALGWTRTGWR